MIPENKIVKTEKQMRPIVESWLQRQAYYVAHEVMLCGYCDLIGCRWAERIGRRIPSMLEIVSVELKISDIKGVRHQAQVNKIRADYSYAAMPIKKCETMRPQSLQGFRDLGVGLLGVDENVHIIIEAQRNEIQHSSDVCRRLWNFKRRHGE